MILELHSDPKLMDNQASRQRFVSIVDKTLRSTGMTRHALLHRVEWGLLTECKKRAPDIPLSFLTQLKKTVSVVVKIRRQIYYRV
jgi:glycerophosphoryl diester phosphodiesterase